MSEIITDFDEEYYYRLDSKDINIEPCLECKWFDKENLFCDKTHDSLLCGCVCVKRFDDINKNIV